MFHKAFVTFVTALMLSPLSLVSYAAPQPTKTLEFLKKYGCPGSSGENPEDYVHLIVASNPPGLEARFGTSYIGRTPVDLYVLNFNKNALMETFHVSVTDPVTGQLLGASPNEAHYGGKLYIYTFGPLSPALPSPQAHPYPYGSCLLGWNAQHTLSAAERNETRIVVETKPPGAMLYINGTAIGQTPLHTFIHALPANSAAKSVMSELSWPTGQDIDGRSNKISEDELMPVIGSTIYIYKDLRP